MKEKFKNDIAISFAEEDRNIALCIYLALKLKLPNSQSYYYPEKQSQMIGKDLKGKLKEIYRHESKYVILIVSKDYVDKKKEFVSVEIDAFMPRFLMEKSTYLIPIMVDETSIEEVHEELEGITTFKWDYNPEELAEIIYDLFEKKKIKSHKNDLMNQKEIKKKEDKGKIAVKDSSLKKSPVISGGGYININY
jgi:hypothetical protein